MLNFGFATPKRHILAQNRVFDVFCVNVRGGVLAVGDCYTPFTRYNRLSNRLWNPFDNRFDKEVVSCKRCFRTTKNSRV